MPLLHQHLMERTGVFLSDNAPIVITLCDMRAQAGGATAPTLSLCDVQAVDTSGSNVAPTFSLEDINVDFVAPPAVTPPTIDFTGTDASPWARGLTKTFVCVVDDASLDNITDFIVSDSFNQSSVLTILFESWNGSSFDPESTVQITPHAFRPGSGLGSHTRFRVTITFAINVAEPTGSVVVNIFVSNDEPANATDTFAVTVT